MTQKVKTRKGQVCRFPDGTIVTEKGATVERSSFLARRLRDGSVIDAAEKLKTTKAKKDADQ